MEPEIIVGILAVFVSGGALGASGALLGQWVFRRLSSAPRSRGDVITERAVERLQAEMSEMSTRLHSVDTRLDFTEQLLGGALLGSPAPEAPPAPDQDDADEQIGT